MSGTESEQPSHCSVCEDELVDGKCMNVNCSVGQQNVSTAAGRRTAKQRGTAARTTAEPRAWRRSGGVD